MLDKDNFRNINLNQKKMQVSQFVNKIRPSNNSLELFHISDKYLDIYFRILLDASPLS
mgnify:FL=1